MRLLSKQNLAYLGLSLAGFLGFLFREWILQVAKDNGLFTHAEAVASKALGALYSFLVFPFTTHILALSSGVVIGWQLKTRLKMKGGDKPFVMFTKNIAKMERLTVAFNAQWKTSKKSFELSEEFWAEQRAFYTAARGYGLTTPNLEKLTPPQIVAALQTFIDHMKPLARDNFLSEAQRASIEVSDRVGTR